MKIKMSRKNKKRLLDRKIDKCKLRKMLSETIIGNHIKTMYEIVSFKPHGVFCPKCGETGYIGSGNMTEYPEHWEKFYCLRCSNIVGYIDNSPFVHALECKDNNYNPVF